MNIFDVKEYLRVDGSDDDILIDSLINAAEMYVENATGVTVDDTNDLHKLSVNLLVTNWYENREPIGNASKLGFGLDSILFQISLSGNVSGNVSGNIV